jgi:CheY-like chemotaxis protein
MRSSVNNPSLTILIVDDDKDDQLLLKQAIEKEVPSAIVESVFDGSGALGYFGSCIKRPDLIFLDLNMSVLSGRDTIKVLRKNDNLKEVPVIILSASKNEAEKQQVLKLGASAFYYKPSNNKDLLKIVQEVKTKWLEIKKPQSA